MDPLTWVKPGFAHISRLHALVEPTRGYFDVPMTGERSTCWVTATPYTTARVWSCIMGCCIQHAQNVNECTLVRDHYSSLEDYVTNVCLSVTMDGTSYSFTVSTPNCNFHTSINHSTEMKVIMWITVLKWWRLTGVLTPSSRWDSSIPYCNHVIDCQIKCTIGTRTHKTACCVNECTWAE